MAEGRSRHQVGMPYPLLSVSWLWLSSKRSTRWAAFGAALLLLCIVLGPLGAKTQDLDADAELNGTLPPASSTNTSSSAPGATGSARIELSANTAEAQPDSDVRFEVEVSNPGDAILGGLNLEAVFDSTQMTVTEAGIGQAAPGRIQWLNGGLQPRETKTLFFTGKMAPGLTHGTKVSVSARLTGSSLTQPAVSVTEVGIMVQLPETGGMRLQPLLRD